MTTILSRIQDIVTAEGITIGAFERSIGASKGVISRAINNGTDIQAKWLQIIVENYPRYSADWLLSGKGSMLKNLPTNSSHQYLSDSEIINEDAIPIIPGSLAKKPNVDILEVVQDSTEGMEISKVHVEDLPVSLWWRVHDRSLEPEIRFGSKVALLAYPKGEEDPIPGTLYGIDTYTNGLILRRLYPHEKGYIGKTYKPDEYPDMIISHDNIIRIYHALVEVRRL